MADNVQFIGPRDGADAGAPPHGGAPQRSQGAPFNEEGPDAPAGGDFAEDDDIPF